MADEVIAQFQKNSREEIRVTVNEFKKNKYIHVRTYVGFEGDEMKPTQKGIAIAVELFPELKKAMKLLEARLVEQGLIDPPQD
ncbi:MAG: transcriptional coactivator p15/PC4 family protein [Acidobacteria bacterium]|nr:transcriptional coactivator p15/PC4 family protein [Acidobacteriota bacterium]